MEGSRGWSDVGSTLTWLHSSVRVVEESETRPVFLFNQDDDVADLLDLLVGEWIPFRH